MLLTINADHSRSGATRSGGKGEDMTIKELQDALDRIPKTGAINKARRRAIQAQILALIAKM